MLVSRLYESEHNIITTKTQKLTWATLAHIKLMIKTCRCKFALAQYNHFKYIAKSLINHSRECFQNVREIKLTALFWDIPRK